MDEMCNKVNLKDILLKENITYQISNGKCIDPSPTSVDNSGMITLKYQCRRLDQLKSLQIRSDPINTRSMLWRLMLTTKPTQRSFYKNLDIVIDDNISDDLLRHLSVYVQCDPETDSKFWHCYAKCKITLVNSDPAKSITKEFRNNFSKKENDFGYSEFILLPKLLDPENGFVDTIKNTNGNGEVDFFVTLIAQITTEYPHGVDWDSRGNTNHVGLLNLGATCYMNSMLQTFFFTNQLRLATYNTPTYMDDNDNSIMYALQYIFYQLQFSQSAVDTTRLTQAFGWNQADSFQQHDVQEFCRILLESMENSMRGTAAENIIAKLLESKPMSFIKCLHVDYQSERLESLYDIQLKVKGLKNVYESFDEYIKIEKLDGDNKYAADGYGYQDANKGVIFTHFPPVLHLHLMRFTFDLEQLEHVKIKDRYEFPEELNLDRYLHKDYVNPDDPAIYSLAAVLVHIGGTNSGHYVVYVNPDCSGQWLKFDDELVVKVNKNEAIEDNFGGSGINVFKPGTTAYMLVYVRNSAKDHIFKHISSEDIPTDLVSRITRDMEKEKMSMFIQDNQKDLTNVMVFLEDCLYACQSKGLVENQCRGCNFVFFNTYSLHHALSYICSQLKINLNRCRVWMFPEELNNNNAVLPKFVHPSQYNQQLKSFTTFSKMLNLFVDPIDNSDVNSDTVTPFSSLDSVLVVDDDNESEHSSDKRPLALSILDSTDEALIFVKYYDPLSSELFYAGRLYVDVSKKWNDYIVSFLEKCETLPDCDTTDVYNQCVKENNLNINLYVDNGKDLPTKIINFDACIDATLPKNGCCIVCIQGNKNVSPSKSIVDFSQFIFQKNTAFTVKFIDKSIPGATERYFTVTCSPNSKYDDLIKIAGTHILHPLDQIQLYYSPQKSIDIFKLEKLTPNNPLTIFDITKKSKLFSTIDLSNSNERTCVIFYECLDITIDKLNNNVLLHLKFVPNINREQSSQLSSNNLCRDTINKYSSPFHIPLLLPKSSTILDLISAANDYLRAVAYPLKNSLRVLEVITSKVVCVLTDEISVLRITPAIEKTLVIEEIPTDQLQPFTHLDRLVNCCFSRNKNFRQFVGVPFLLKISYGMTYNDIHTQITSRLSFYSDSFIRNCTLFVMRTQEIDCFPNLDDSESMQHEFPFERNFGTPNSNGLGDVKSPGIFQVFVPNVVIIVNISSPSYNSPPYNISGGSCPVLKIAK